MKSPMTYQERLAYGRGYNTGAAGRWPAHKPPHPPEPITRALIEALQELRDAYDGLCATLDESDEIVALLDPSISQADEAMEKVTIWLREATSEKEQGR